MVKASAFLVVVLCSMLGGCESGHEIAGVSTATSVRQTDGRVAVTATLSCMLVSGMGRADDTCDADGTTVCVNAKWFAANNSTPVASSRGCAYLSPIKDFAFVVTSDSPIPQTEALTIVVSADGQDQVLAPVDADGNIPAGSPGKSVSIASP
jgi:hypothetical protein